MDYNNFYTKKKVRNVNWTNTDLYRLFSCLSFATYKINIPCGNTQTLYIIEMSENSQKQIRNYEKKFASKSVRNQSL